MSDEREKVVRSRGLIKKIQMAIPGYRGYRKREDLRIADSLLRSYISERLESDIALLKRFSAGLSQNLLMEPLQELTSTVNYLETMMLRIRHAEQGYSGISPDARFDVKELDKLYDLDSNLITSVEAIDHLVNGLPISPNEEDMERMTETLLNIRKKVKELEDAFLKRQEFVKMYGG